LAKCRSVKSRLRVNDATENLVTTHLTTVRQETV